MSESTTSNTRRNFLSAAVGGIAALLAGSVARPPSAEADHGGSVQLGHNNQTAAVYTTILRTDANVACWLATGVDGLHGSTDDDIGYGVFAIHGGNGAAVRGWAQGSGAGLEGLSASGVGVLGIGPIGVSGETPEPSGIGVRAQNYNGICLQVIGKAVFSSTGYAVVLQGRASTTVGGFGLPFSSNALFLATVQGDVAGVWVRGVRKTSPTSIKILLNKAAPSNVKVGWFIVN
ncbi:MAG: hypothetical protein WEB00_14530 [Dehalococcoidia bacterium]